MAKTVIIKLTGAGNRTGPFTIYDNLDNVLAVGVTKEQLIVGQSYTVADAITTIILKSTGKCQTVISMSIQSLTVEEIAAITYTELNTASVWRHLTNIRIYNKFYDNIEPYVIEYPFAYEYHDEILQNVKDYTRAYKYFNIPDGVFNDNAQVQTDDQWFNKAIVYNGQQSSGVLELVPKPINNLKEYLKYPLYNAESKTITYTKSDSFYGYNTFWSLVKNKAVPLFITSCESLSIDKVVNQVNMDYGKRSFKKEPLRAKGLLVRHILDNSSEAHLVSQFITTPAQISYK
jgi:hypothetical protein